MKLIADFWWKIRWSSRATAWLHVLAMYSPFNSWRLFFYRLRGTKIGRNVYIVQGSFLEESRPWLIEIEDNVRIGHNVYIITHDAIYHGYDDSIPIRYGKVLLKKGCAICGHTVIMPGVTIGECSVVSPCSLVNKDVPKRVIVSGSPAKVMMSLDRGLAMAKRRAKEYATIDEGTKFPRELKRYPFSKSRNNTDDL